MAKSIKESIVLIITFIVAVYGWYSIAADHSHPRMESISVTHDNISLKTAFCSRDDCIGMITDNLKADQDTRCAFYDLNNERLIKALEENEAEVIIDQRYEDNIKNTEIDYVAEKSSGYMHNKFCIFGDDRIITGSFNPSHKEDEDDNNMVLIKSDKITKNFLHKFDRLSGKYESEEMKRKNRPFPIVRDEVDNITVETLFCPEDRCEDRVLEHLTETKDRIYFMTFSFTSNPIADVMYEKMNNEDIKGIFDAWQAGSRWSRFHSLNKTEPRSFIVSKGPGLMHHKVFILDNKKVITGSYNPSANADKNNDENIIIIEDKETTERFMNEFNLLWSENGR